ncbi:MAG: hypothetical protein IPN96_09045 [Anaerolineales bacterium]|nr:hypothetical protein [Anaerolineales bacterium]MBK8822078.1 hypothetical protein [Anaerolineales bacterium]
MPGKSSKNKKQTKSPETTQNRTAQIVFAIFALILILSMVLSSVANY